MPLADTSAGAAPVPRASADAASRQAAADAFLEALADVLVGQPRFHDFAGAIDADAARSVWTWIARDVAASQAARLGDAIASGAAPAQAFDPLLPEILDALKANTQAERDDPAHEGRNTIQMGGAAVRTVLPRVIMALRRRPLLAQAARFGAAVGTLSDEAALAEALKTVSIANPLTRALWMHAMVARLGNPSRTMAAAVALAEGRSEDRMVAAGFGPLVEAILSHAQNQIGLLVNLPALFSDIDLACKAVDRFHRLMRALNYNLEIDRNSRWGRIVADLTGRISERLERPLRDINANVNQALRRAREGDDRIDPDKVLDGYKGLYLLMAVRASRDSLAVNALLDQAWADTGQTLEVLMARALDAYRARPADPVARERIDVGIRMAEIRFNAEYADILKRARDVAGRRPAAQGAGG